MSVGFGVGALILLLVLTIASHVVVLRAGCRSLGERVPGLLACVGAVLVSGLASMGASLMVLCMGGILVSAMSAPVGLFLQLVVAIVSSGWVLSRLLRMPLDKALAIETVWGGIQLAIGLLVALVGSVASAIG